MLAFFSTWNFKFGYSVTFIMIFGFQLLYTFMERERERDMFEWYLFILDEPYDCFSPDMNIYIQILMLVFLSSWSFKFGYSVTLFLPFPGNWIC